MTNNQDDWMSRALKLEAALQEIIQIDQGTVRRVLGSDEKPNQTAINLRRMGEIAKAALAGTR